MKKAWILLEIDAKGLEEEFNIIMTSAMIEEIVHDAFRTHGIENYITKITFIDKKDY